jgi:hypothetical protein
MTIGELGISFLQKAAIWEEHGTKIAGCRRRVDRAVEAIPDKDGYVSRVIDMGMGEHDRVDRFRLDWQRVPVAKPQLLETLEQTTVNQNRSVRGLNEVFRPGNGSDCTKKRYAHRSSLSLFRFDAPCQFKPSVLSRENSIRQVQHWW